MQQEKDYNEQGKQGEVWVEQKAGQNGWAFIRAPDKTRKIDGHLILPDPEHGSSLHVAVQVKTGTEFVQFPKKTAGAAAFFKCERTDVLHWHQLNVPVIIIWILDPYNPFTSKNLWADAARASRASGKLKVNINSEFGEAAKDTILNIARKHAGRPLIPQVSSNFLFPQKVKEVKKLAKDFYSAWMRTGSHSPALGHVEVTLKGWRHLVKITQSQRSVIHRLSLVPMAKEVLERASKSHFVRKLNDKPTRREFHVVNGICHQEHEANIVIEVVVEVEKRGKRVISAKLFSIFERKSWKS